ncbi:hypothetical protein [Aeromicrobium alkaliterrae]|uniref:LppX_LprAFG lipoprotein n=1 Tax=Aeromicrobium alkaliterrae TaxID=302168 RepID=A0ABP4VRB7_9ACTN
MTSRLRSRAAVSAVAALAVLALAACSGGGDDSADPSPSSSATTSDEPAGDDLTQEEFVSTVTAAMVESGSVHVVLNLGAGGAAGEGDIAVGQTPQDSAISMTVNGNEVLLVDGSYYVNLAQASGGMYLEVDPDGTGQFASTFGPVLEQAAPVSQLRLFESALVGFAVGEGTQEVDGVTTTPYVLTVDPAKVLSAAQVALVEGALPPTMDVTLYLGPDDLPRRVVSTIAGADLTIEYSAWGEPVDIEAPPADLVTDGAPFGL